MKSDLLNRQFDLYSERWKDAHDTVMRNYKESDELRRFVSLGIMIFNELSRGVDRSFEGARARCIAWTRWIADTHQLLAAISELEREGYEVEDTAALRKLHMAVEQHGSEIKDVEAAMKRFIDGRGKPLNELFRTP